MIVAAIGRGGVKDAVLEEERIARIEFEIFDFDTARIDFAFRELQRLGAQVCAARHQRHAAIRLLEIRQAITDFDADEREFLVTEILWDADVAMPAATERGCIRRFRAFVDDGRRVQVDVRAQ